MDTNDHDGPPLFRSWRGMYVFVLGTLAALIAILSALSWLYR